MPKTPDPSIAVHLAGVPLRSPILTAAGTAGTLNELADVLDLSHLGAVVTKSITRHQRTGNDFPRITHTRAGMLNAIGLANPGLDAWEAEIAPKIASVGCPVFCSVAGDSIEDYVAIASTMDAHRTIPIIELNVSCPNVHSGLEFGLDPKALAELVAGVAEAIEHAKVFVKLSPIVVGTPNTLIDLAAVAVEAGADGLTLCNTVPAMGIDVHTRQPILSNTTGGLSGPAIHPITVRLVHLAYSELCKHEGVPIMAAGGVTRWEDAGEFVLAGASAIQVGAGLLADPRSMIKINKGLGKWVAQQGKKNIAELVGQVNG